jgi:hypothetical protein
MSVSQGGAQPPSCSPKTRREQWSKNVKLLYASRLAAGDGERKNGNCGLWH